MREAGAERKHPATKDAWTWLASSEAFMPLTKLARIERTLRELDLLLWNLDEPATAQAVAPKDSAAEPATEED